MPLLEFIISLWKSGVFCGITDTLIKEARMDHKHSKKKTARRGRGVLGAILLFLILLGAAFLYASSKINKLSFDEASFGTEEQTSERMKGSISEEAAAQSVTLPQGEAETAEEIVNILFLGTDARIPGTSDPGRADSTMLCSLNTKTGDVKLISFERGIYVPIPDMGQDLLTHAYHWGGPALSQSIIEECFLLDVAGYAQVDFENFKLVVDTIGGVDIELNDAEAHALNLPVGVNHLDGVQALSYCRLRSIDSDWERQARQRTTIKAALKQIRNLSLSELDATLNTILPLIHTNLSKIQISRLMLSAARFIRGNVSQLQVPDQNWTNGYIKCDFEYEHKKITNFIYGTNYEITSPY